MSNRTPRFMIAILLVALLAIPVIANSQGPPAKNSEDNETSRYGCTCHGNGAAGDRAVVMITGVPVMYDSGESYQMTITVADSTTLAGADGNTKAGFLLSSSGVGDFTWESSQDLRDAEDNANDVSHSATGNGVWVLTWSAPSENIGDVHFWLVGNSVDNSGLPDEGDYWNTLTFSILAPGTIEVNDNAATLETRTISVGDYDTLFVIEESEAEKEAEHQEALSNTIFEKGNLFYWTSLTALLVGAVFQREIMERRYETGPEFLAMELAYPQGLRRGLIALVTFVMAVNWTANGGQDDFIIGATFFVSAWATYGVYRTVRSAKAEQTVHDVM